MKKNILGLTVFILIVSATAVYTIFDVRGKTSIYISEPNSQIKMSKEPHCTLGQRVIEPEDVQPIISQAVYNLKTKKLSWKCDASSNGNGRSLILLLVDEKKVSRYIDSIPVENCSQEVKTINLKQQASNLSKLSPQANLYIIPDNSKRLSTGEIDDEMLDFVGAIAVTVERDR